MCRFWLCTRQYLWCSVSFYKVLTLWHFDKHVWILAPTLILAPISFVVSTAWFEFSVACYTRVSKLVTHFMEGLLGRGKSQKLPFGWSRCSVWQALPLEHSMLGKKLQKRSLMFGSFHFGILVTLVKWFSLRCVLFVYFFLPVLPCKINKRLLNIFVFSWLRWPKQKRKNGMKSIHKKFSSFFSFKDSMAHIIFLCRKQV